MKKLLAIAVVGILASSSFAVDLINENFDSGVWVGALTAPVWTTPTNWWAEAGGDQNSIYAQNTTASFPSNNGYAFGGFGTDPLQVADGAFGIYVGADGDSRHLHHDLVTAEAIDGVLGLKYDTEYWKLRTPDQDNGGGYAWVRAFVDIDNDGYDEGQGDYTLSLMEEDPQYLAAPGAGVSPAFTLDNTDAATQGYAIDGNAPQNRVPNILSGPIVLDQAIPAGAGVEVEWHGTNGSVTIDGVGGINTKRVGYGIDNVRLGNLNPGDADGNFEVNLSDFNVLRNNWGTGTEWGTADWVDDDTVNLDDFNALRNSWGSYVPGVPNDLSGGEVELWVNPGTGETWLVGDNASLGGHQITSASGMVSANYAAQIPGTLGVYGLLLSQTDNDIAEGLTTGSRELNGQLALGAIYDTAADAEDLVFSYVDANTGQTVQGDVFYIPEPATMALLAVGGLGALLRRRR